MKKEKRKYTRKTITSESEPVVDDTGCPPKVVCGMSYDNFLIALRSANLGYYGLIRDSQGRKIRPERFEELHKNRTTPPDYGDNNSKLPE